MNKNFSESSQQGNEGQVVRFGKIFLQRNTQQTNLQLVDIKQDFSQSISAKKDWRTLHN